MSSFWNTLTNTASSVAENVGDFFSLEGPISASANAHPDDVVKTKTALQNVGAYTPPNHGITDIPDSAMIKGVETFQKRNGLRVDGVMKPNGPTAATLNKQLSTQKQPNHIGAFDSPSGRYYKTDQKGNYYDLTGQKASVPSQIEKRLNKTYQQSNSLSGDAEREIGTHLSRRRARSPYEPERQTATDLAIRTTYNEEEQAQIKKYAAQNPQPVMPKDHDVWRGNVQTMGKVMGLDHDLLQNAGLEAIPAMAATLSYNTLTSPKEKRDALEAIHALKQSGHPTLAHELHKKLTSSLVNPTWNRESMTTDGLKNLKIEHAQMETFFSTLSNLPYLPPQLSIGATLMSKIFQDNQHSTDMELKRHQ